MERKHPASRLALISVVVLIVAACGGPGATATPSPTAGPTAVTITLAEWSVGASATTAKAGSVKFTVTNSGTILHEFVVIKTDLALTALPTDATGTVDEAGGGMTVEDEIEDIPVGATQDLTVTLQPGAYVLICNIYDDEAHYQQGMRNSFTVTP